MKTLLLALFLLIILIMFNIYLNKKYFVKKDFFNVPDECRNLHIQSNLSVDACRNSCLSNKNSCNHLVQDFLSVLNTAKA